jgi:hypothetical protein
MAKFEAYEKFADRLVLPIGGKEYTIPEVGAADGIKFNVNVATEDAEPISNEEFFHMFLGTAYDEMVADNVPGNAILRAAMTALADWQSNRATAEVMWATGADPKAVTDYLKAKAPNRASRRSTGTASATATRSRASTSSTKTSPTKK